MELPTDLLDDLATLDVALGDGTDLAAHLGHLIRSLVESVPTLLAIAITVTIDGYPLAIGVTPEDPSLAQASIAITMPTETSGTVSSQLIAHATDSAAFGEVRADAIHGLSIHPDMIVLDAHLEDRTPSTTLADLSTINQAVGILIDRGLTPDDARTELHRHAAASGQTMIAQARALIADVVDGRPTPDEG